MATDAAVRLEQVFGGVRGACLRLIAPLRLQSFWVCGKASQGVHAYSSRMPALYPLKRDRVWRTSPRTVSPSAGDLVAIFPFPVGTTRIILRDVDDSVAGADYITTPTHQGGCEQQLTPPPFRAPREHPRPWTGQCVHRHFRACLQTNRWLASGPMVYRKNTRVIVMTTREWSMPCRAQSSMSPLLPPPHPCEQCFFRGYWPELHGTKTMYGRLLVCNAAEYQAQANCCGSWQVWRPDQTHQAEAHIPALPIRGSARTVKHYHYFTGRTHGVPAEPAGVLVLPRLGDPAQACIPGAGPMVCTAGGDRYGDGGASASALGMVADRAQYKFVYLSAAAVHPGDQLRLTISAWAAGRARGGRLRGHHRGTSGPRPHRERPGSADSLSWAPRPADPGCSPVPRRSQALAGVSTA
ncbi:Tyrosine-protein phosphatase non-receptor type 6 [Camelus dromedarius]|uniref:Tyrosine-protein phosphatase non-receptor type 6 n=1 Tax=Camelus dromedarius TaxID=9838 RepID=A0A5N4DDL6_CAMDR|nr:Tyrosine-protein phosphatase non-receptor type 6 [Camelus dromedarius]